MDSLGKDAFIKFPESYNKVRKLYGLTSCLLLFWGLLGINVNSFEGEGLRISIDAPEAIPIVLIGLVIYYGLRLNLEWDYYGYDTILKKHNYVHFRQVSNKPYVDYYLSHAIGSASIAVYLLQDFFEITIIEIFTLDITTLFTYTILLVALLWSVYNFAKHFTIAGNSLKKLISTKKFAIIYPIIILFSIIISLKYSIFLHFFTVLILLLMVSFIVIYIYKAVSISS